MKITDLKLSRLQELVMVLTTEEIKTIIKALEWCVEDICREENVGCGKTNTRNIFKVLDKLTEADLQEKR